jgi:Skp family chaperone for outer membrane proteins
MSFLSCFTLPNIHITTPVQIIREPTAPIHHGSVDGSIGSFEPSRITDEMKQKFEHQQTEINELQQKVRGLEDQLENMKESISLLIQSKPISSIFTGPGLASPKDFTSLIYHQNIRGSCCTTETGIIKEEIEEAMQEKVAQVQEKVAEVQEAVQEKVAEVQEAMQEKVAQVQEKVAQVQEIKKMVEGETKAVANLAKDVGNMISFVGKKRGGGSRKK